MTIATPDLSGQIALVTGASRGLGRATALAFAGAGAHVCALARTVGALEELDDAVKAAGGQATLIPLDLADAAGLARMAAALHERWGRLDLWLHSAIYAPPLSPAHHVGQKEFDGALATNVGATRTLIRMLDPLLRLSGVPLAVLPADDRTGERHHGCYAASKAAQSALWQAWAREAEGRIRIAEIAPPPMATAVRGRFYPGEAKDGLTRPDAVAAELLRVLPELGPGPARPL